MKKLILITATVVLSLTAYSQEETPKIQGLNFPKYSSAKKVQDRPTLPIDLIDLSLSGKVNVFNIGKDGQRTKKTFKKLHQNDPTVLCCAQPEQNIFKTELVRIMENLASNAMEITQLGNELVETCNQDRFYLEMNKALSEYQGENLQILSTEVSDSVLSCFGH